MEPVLSREGQGRRVDESTAVPCYSSTSSAVGLEGGQGEQLSVGIMVIVERGYGCWRGGQSGIDPGNQFGLNEKVAASGAFIEAVDGEHVLSCLQDIEVLCEVEPLVVDG